MSQSEFEIVNNISEVCKVVVQVTMFIILWVAVFDIKKAKRDSIVAGLFFFYQYRDMVSSMCLMGSICRISRSCNRVQWNIP